MIRSFVALPLPDDLCLHLENFALRLPVPRIVPAENLHLTLAFLGDQSAAALEEVHLQFEALRLPGFLVQLQGLDLFGGGRPRNLHVAAAASAELVTLQKSVAAALRRADIEIERRRFVPHVTLARFAPHQVDAGALGRKAVETPLAMTSFPATEFRLYQSHLGPEGARYETLASYPLN